ncbi:hybrid sensor histidine kinase/response regulator transcription factor [Algoriphagus sp.]|uniref:hybrid sensor histidine kinase/response regulator transcription factor n=1 Tax=Algoriphagus sp. TaxID=1872435 RepID=UPI003F6F9C5F
MTEKLRGITALVFHLWLCQITCTAQDLHFNTLSINEGLPTNSISNITQDRYGFLWISTNSGLARYDGNKISVFRKSTVLESLPSNLLTDVIPHGDYVYVATWNGLCKVNIKTFEFSRIELENINIIRSLYLGNNNILWIGSANGIIKYGLESGEYQVFTSDNSNLSHNMVRSIYQDRAGTVWVGTFDGLNYMRVGQKRFSQVSLPVKENGTQSNLLVLDIKPSVNEDPNLWIGTEQGLFRVDSKRMEVLPIDLENNLFSNPVIKTIFPDDQGKLWLGTDFGLNIYDPISKENTQHFHHPVLPYSIANNVIWKIMEDRHGVIWLATSNGLSKVNKSGDFYSVTDITNSSNGQQIGNQIKSMMISQNGDYWLATQHGVILLDPETSTKKLFTSQGPPEHRLIMNNVSDLIEDEKGRIWIGTAGGINIWDPQENRMDEIRADSTNGLQSNYIGHFAQEPDGTIWVNAWQGGLYRIDLPEDNLKDIVFEEVKDLESNSEKFVYGDDYIWTIEYDELYKIDPETMKSFPVSTFNQAVKGKMINTLYFSKSGEIWAGTLNGLIQYSPKTDSLEIHDIIAVTEESINSIIEDLGGNIWSVRNSSIHKFEINTGQLHSYPLDNLLPIKSFYYNCAARRTDGQLLFGGDNGFISFSPFQVQKKDINPSVYITDLEINNKPIRVVDPVNGRVLLEQDISFTDELRLNYNERSFTLQFSTLDYLQPDHNRHSYQLLGFDDVWHQVSGSNNTAVYSNLPAGTYTFLVKSINLDEQGETAVRKLKITVLPPFLLRWYFIVAYALFLIAMIYYALKFYSGRVRLTNELKISKLKVEHAEELEKTKENFFTNISHELRTPISLILPPLRQVQLQPSLDQKSHTLLQLAEKNASRLLKLVNQVLDFSRMTSRELQLSPQEIDLVSFCHQVFILFEDTANRHHIRYSFEHSCQDTMLWADADKLETILFNLLSNAFKFTPDYGKITVRISEIQSGGVKAGECKIEVIDSGVGIEQEALTHIFDRFFQAATGKQKNLGSGIGLTLVKDYVMLHHGHISVKSQVNKGSTFIVTLPFAKEHVGTGKSILEDADPKEAHHIQHHHNKWPHVETASEKTTILLIDDNTDILDLIETSLGEKYHFLTAENGEEGLFKANRYLPNVIISDIMMPVMDGISFCEKIKENPKTSPISIILLTARSLPANELEGIKVGADIYLTKPFEIPLLEAYIDQLLARRQELNLYFNTNLMGISHQSRGVDNENNFFVKRVMGIIEANIANPELSVEMISEEMAMSTTHLYRKLKANTNHSAKELIQKYRLKKASLLLQNKEGNVSDIVFQVGFSSQSYFSRAFKAEYGISPKKYQDMFNKNEA